MVYSDFGILVKKRMLDMKINQKELCQRVQLKTNKYFDQPYLSKIISGKSENEIFISAIKDVLRINP